MITDEKLSNLIGFDTFQHFKGGLYVKLCEGIHTETGEILVTYICSVSGKVFHRPKDMFYEEVFKEVEDGVFYKGSRFIRIPSNISKADKKKLKVL